MNKRTKLSQQQIDSLALSFLTVMQEYFKSEQGREAYQKYLNEKENSADNTKSVETNTNDKNHSAA